MTTLHPNRPLIAVLAILLLAAGPWAAARADLIVSLEANDGSGEFGIGFLTITGPMGGAETDIDDPITITFGSELSSGSAVPTGGIDLTSTSPNVRTRSNQTALRNQGAGGTTVNLSGSGHTMTLSGSSSATYSISGPIFSSTGTYKVRAAVPEPGTLAAMGLGLAGLLVARRRRRTA